MEEKIIAKIEEYDYIAIYRHVNPDFDAFGSQLGMYDMIKATYPDKKVFLCGDFSSELVKKYTVVFEHQEVDYTKDILGIVLDTANIERIDDQRYQLCKEIIKIDHHLVVDSYGTLNYEDSSASSASQLVGTIFKDTAMKITKSGAEALYLGIVGDTARLEISRERGSDFVNLLSGVEEYKIWMALTENVADHNWRVSLRSRDYAVNKVAEKYNGGGHMLASGAKLASLEQLGQLLQDLKEIINE